MEKNNNLSLEKKKQTGNYCGNIVHSPLKTIKSLKAVKNAWSSKDPHLELSTRDFTISKQK